VTVRVRDFGSNADLRLMQDLVSRTWTPGSRYHVGDLAWDRQPRADQEPEPTRLWLGDDGRAVAWAWLQVPGGLEFAVDPAHRELLDELIAWTRSQVASSTLDVTCMHSDAASRSTLERLGFHVASDRGAQLYLLRDLESLAVPKPPPGTRVRSVDVRTRPQDLVSRVAGHRAAFHPSRLTEESYLVVTETWPYRDELDVVVEDASGNVLAFCLGWYDEATKVGEFEPVGCIPSARRTGAAAAVCCEVLVRLKALGAERALVYPGYHEGDRGAELFYRSLGFADNDRTVVYTGSSD
jgi:GNAT superfamily N-acetyltransferase